MPDTTSRRRPLRCRLGMHSRKDVACPDGQYVRTCTLCRKELGPFAQYERQPLPRDDPRVREGPHGYFPS
jgi:hypothetical protein